MTIEAAVIRAAIASTVSSRLDYAARFVQTGDRMNSSAFDPEALVDAMAPLIGLALTPESRAETILHLRIAAEQAELLLSTSLGDFDEPAPVFKP